MRTRHMKARLFNVLSVFVLLVPPVGAASKITHGAANVPIEIMLTAEKAHEDPFNDVQVEMSFTDSHGLQRIVPAFWDGGNIWKVRYASAVPGPHRWRARCNDRS